MAGGLEDFLKPLSVVEPMKRWAKATQERNVVSLTAGQGPGGPALAPLNKSTVRHKGHARPGIDTGAMVAAMTDPGCVDMTADGLSADVRGSPRAAAEDYSRVALKRGAPPELKLAAFLTDRSYLSWTSEKTKSGKRKAYPVMKGSPARDFIGIADEDIDRAADDALTTIAKTWGFREA